MCPAVEDGGFGTCAEECEFDVDCPRGHKCCSNGCGHTCVLVRVRPGMNENNKTLHEQTMLLLVLLLILSLGFSFYEKPNLTDNFNSYFLNNQKEINPLKQFLVVKLFYSHIVLIKSRVKQQ